MFCSGLLMAAPVYAATNTFDVNNFSLTLDNHCIFNYGGANSMVDGYKCAWCGTDPAPGNCIQGYAGCIDYGYVANTSEKFMSETGAVYQARTGDKTGVQYRCTDRGWVAINVTMPGTGGDVTPETVTCNRYTYRDPRTGECANCPAAGVFTQPDLDPESEVFVRGDNYEQLLTGCHYGYSAGEQYYDETGSFVFVNTGTCNHNGLILP